MNFCELIITICVEEVFVRWYNKSCGCTDVVVIKHIKCIYSGIIADEENMPGSKNMKKGMRVLLVLIITISLILLFALASLFISLNNDVELHRDLLTSTGLGDTDESASEALAIENEIEKNIVTLKKIAIVMCAIIIVSLILVALSIILLRKRINSQIYRLAYVDEITGLPTKAKHRDDVDQCLKNRSRDYAYVSLEVDNFKYVNDMYGYAYGNYLLKYVATGLSRELLPGELISRTAGSRFGLLLMYRDDEELRKRLLNIFRKIGHMKGNTETDSVYNILFTCGVYRIFENSMDEDAACVRECANLAREAAKHLYDNNIEFYDDKMQQRRIEQAELEFEMRTAFDSRQFVVFLQPKYSTDGEQLVGAEALIRWEHPLKGMIYPNEFIPLFEANGFIVKIDFYVLDCVCACIRRWLDEGVKPVAVSVNLSRVHLYDNELVNRLVETTDRYRVPHNLIEFELTETVVFEELNYLMEVMSNLKAAGFILSMDDFGSGYSSLNMLKKLPVDILKLDKGFIENFHEEETASKDRTIVTHIISMAKALDMEVLAEGVENEKQKDFLLHTDCDMIQGYYYARPMKMEQFDFELRKLRAEKG